MAPGLWNKVKGVFGRIGHGIAHAAKGVYNWVKNGNAQNAINQGRQALNVLQQVNEAVGGDNNNRVIQGANKFLNTGERVVGALQRV